MKTSLWISAVVLAYTWVGYPALLVVLKLLRLRRHGSPAERSAGLTYVTVVLTVRDEEELIESRLRNILDTRFPYTSLDVLVASDGSRDATNAIVGRMAAADSRIALVALEGAGKSAAQQHAIALARGDVVVLTDAEAMFRPDTIPNLAWPFADASVGCSTGRVILRDQESGIAASQGMYWRFEMWLRELESATGVLHTASGQVMAFRKSQFTPFDASHGDDCVIPLDMLRCGLRVVHVDDAVAFDTFPSTSGGELRARTRMTLRNLVCTLDRLHTRELALRPMLVLAIVSHKLMRWATPLFLIAALISNCLLVHAGPWFVALLSLQGSFYALGGIGYVGQRFDRKIPLASPLFSFLLANLGFLLGLMAAASGRRIASYQNQR